MNKKLEYDVLLVDTSTFIENALRLEKGLLGKLNQFKKSPITFIMPDVIYREIDGHLAKKIQTSRQELKDAITQACDHLFFDNNTLDSANALLSDNEKIENLAKSRLDAFLDRTGATYIECAEHLNISSLLEQYFSHKAPFSTSGKKKSEFPDAIALMATEQWAEKYNKSVLAISQDLDWERYCEESERLTYEKTLSNGLVILNKANAPFALLSRLEEDLNNNVALKFLNHVAFRLDSIFAGFTPDQDADSYLHWEPEGCNGWFCDFSFISNEFRLIESDEKYIVLEAKAVITVEAEGEFSLSVHDSVDDDYTHIDYIVVSTTKDFESEILITIAGNLDGPINELTIQDVEIVTPIKRIHFGTLVPDFDGDE